MLGLFPLGGIDTNFPGGSQYYRGSMGLKDPLSVYLHDPDGLPAATRCFDGFFMANSLSDIQETCSSHFSVEWPVQAGCTRYVLS